MAFKMNKPSITQGTAGHKSAVKKAASALKHAMNFGKYHTDFKYEYSFPGDGSKKRSKSSHKHKSAHDGAIIGTQRTVESIEDEKKRDAEREANAKVENKSGTTTTDSGVKKTGSALKQKSWDEDSSSTREEGRGDRGDGIHRSYNRKKAERLQKRSKKAHDKNSEASAKELEGLKKHGKAYFTGEGLSEDEKKANRKSSKKFAKTSQKAAVKEALAKRELGQKGHTNKNKPGVVMRDGKKLKVELPSVDLSGKNFITTRLKTPGKGDRRVGKKKRVSLGSVYTVDAKKVDGGSTIAHRKKYRQDKGVRGNLNTRRDAKGKKKI